MHTHRSDLCLVCRDKAPEQQLWKICEDCQEKGYCMICGGFAPRTGICPICFPATYKAALMVLGAL